MTTDTIILIFSLVLGESPLYNEDIENIFDNRNAILEFSCGTVGFGSSVVTAAAQVLLVVRVQFLAWELPSAVGMVEKEKEKKELEREKERNALFLRSCLFFM